MTTWNKIHRPRKKVAATPLLFAFIFVLSITAQFFIPNPASAAPTSTTKESCEAAGGVWKNLATAGGIPTMGCSGASVASQQSLDWQIKSLLYYRSIGDCFNKHSASRIYVDDVKSGEWFIQGGFNDYSATGPYLRNELSDIGDDSVTACFGDAGKELVTKALNHWGVSSTELLCGAGFTWSSYAGDKQRCTNVTPDSSDSLALGWTSSGTPATSLSAAMPSVLSYLKNKFYSGSTPELNSAGWYSFYRTVFFNQCATTQSFGTGTTTKPSTSNNRDISFYDVDTDGSVTQRWYRLDSAMVNKSFTTRIGGANSFSDVNRTCEEIAKNHLSEAEAKKYAVLVVSQPDIANPPPASGDEANAEAGTSSCQVEGIGWVLCPVINAMAGMADATFGLVAAFMVVEPLGFNTDNPLYGAWSIMRNIANVAFVIAFLIIIFSQLTGTGISNYGVKKMLPRLVIAAILVNLSYFLCALAVDISNILGMSVQQILTSIADSVGGEENTITEEWSSIATSVLSLGAIGTAGVVGVTVFSSLSIWAMLAGLLPLLVTALLALIVAFLVLLARQAFIIILIVISPLAFVAFLLPNTEDLFNKWRGFFITLLALFPMMALVFGGSVLASSIMRAGAINSMGSSEVATATMGFFVYLGSVAVLAIPFFITPVLIKLSGGVLNRFAGFINNPNKGPFDSMRKGAERVRDNARNRGMANKLRSGKLSGIGARRRARIDTVSSSLGSEVNHAQTEYVSGEIEKNARFARSAAGGMSAPTDAITRVTASAISSKDKLEAEEVSATNVILKNAELDMPKMRQLALGGSVTSADGKTFSAENNLAMQRAAIQQMVASNDVEGMNAAWNNSSIRNNTDLRSTFADSLQSSSSRPGYFSQGMIAGLRQSPTMSTPSGLQPNPQAAPANADSVIEMAIKAKAYSPEKIATADKDDLKEVARVMRTSQNLTDDEKQAIMLNAEVALTDVKLSTVVGKNKDRIIEIQNYNPTEGSINIPRGT